MLNIDYFKHKRRAKLSCQTGSARVASAKTQLNRSHLCVSRPQSIGRRSSPSQCDNETPHKAKTN